MPPAGIPASPYPDLDQGHLDHLADYLGQPRLLELLADGLMELGDQIELAETLAARGQRAALARLAHRMTGAAGCLGLTRLSLAAAELEASAKQGRELTIAPLVGTAQPALAALRRHIDERSS